MATSKNTNLFLDGIFGEDKCTSPNRVKLNFTSFDDGTYKPRVLYGLLASEPTVSTGNKWGPVLSDISTLTDFSSIIGNQNMFSWIGASVQCWKGTDPIKVGVDFYLINYKRGLQLEERLKELTKLTALTEVKGDNKLMSKIAVSVHGGYAANVISSNESYFQNVNFIENASNYVERGKDVFHEAEAMTPKGTVTLYIGNKMAIRNLLVARIDSTPSMVEVANGKPLYYRVSVSFIGVKPLLSPDVDKMF